MAEIDRRGRMAALDELQRVEQTINQISTWLSMGDEDKAAIELEQASTFVRSAAWCLERPVRVRPEGWLAGG